MRADAPTAIILHGLEGSSNSQYVVRQRRQALARGRQRDPHEHAQLRRHGSPLAHALPLRPFRRRARRHPLLLRSRAAQLRRAHRLLHGRQPGAEARRRARHTRPRELRSVIGVSPASISATPPTPCTSRSIASTSAASSRTCSSASAARPPSSHASTTRTAPTTSRPCASSTTASRRATPASPARTTTTSALPAPASSPPSPSPRSSCTPSTIPSSASLPPPATFCSPIPHITLLEPAHGGHCAFLAQPDPAAGNDGYWAEHTLLRFLLANA